MRTELLLVILVASLVGLSLQDNNVPPKEFDTTDLKSSAEAILAEEAQLVAKARKTTTPMVR